MIPLLFAAMALADPPKACPDVITPEAMICRAIRAQGGGEFRSAAEGFQQAAVASPDSDPTTARLWAAAGNMWIAASENGKAAFALDKALGMKGLVAEQRGEALLDRARAAEALGDLKVARSRLDQAMETVSQDPFAWFFSAALAIREGDSVKAQSSINRALALAPAEPLILFEAGHVAQFTGDEAKARDYWRRAAAADPNSDIGKAAKQAIALLDAPPAPTPADARQAIAAFAKRRGDPRLGLMQFLHTMLRVHDPDATVRFFKTLGLEERRRIDNQAGRFTLIFLGVPGEKAEVELTHNWAPEDGEPELYGGGRNFGHLAYRVDDIYAQCARLQAAGIIINRPPRDGRMAFVRSPGGISIELLQKGTALPPAEPWASMANEGEW